MPPKHRKKATKNAKVTVESLIEQGNAALARIQPELALSYFLKAHSMQPDDTNIMDALSDVHLQLGNSDEALRLLLHSTSLAPDKNVYKWMYLAQLQEGLDALNSYQFGIKMLSDIAQTADNKQTQQDLQKQIAKSYSSIAELYLTDLCYEEEAEKNCQEAITAAQLVDPNNLDVSLVLASLRLSQSNPQDASNIMQIISTKLKDLINKIQSRSVLEEIAVVNSNCDDKQETDDFDDFPGVDFCVSAVKLMLECAQHSAPSLANDALEISSKLLLSDDENIEICYLCGEAALTLPSPDYIQARHYFEDTKDLIEQERKLLQMQNEFNERISPNLNELSSSTPCDDDDDVALVSYEDIYQLVIDRIKFLDETEGGTIATGMKEGEGEGRKLPIQDSDNHMVVEDLEQEEEEEEWSTDEEEGEGEGV